MKNLTVKENLPGIARFFRNNAFYFSYLPFFRFAARCLWDSDTDNYAQDIFTNVSQSSPFVYLCEEVNFSGINSLRIQGSNISLNAKEFLCTQENSPEKS